MSSFLNFIFSLFGKSKEPTNTKPFWLTILLGIVGIVSSHFLTKSGAEKDCDERFAALRDSVAAIRPDTVRVRYDSIIVQIRWLSAKPLKLSYDDSLSIASSIKSMSEAEREERLLFLSQEREAEPAVDTLTIGDSIKAITTTYITYSPLQGQPFGRYSYLNEVVYPRTSVFEQPAESSPLVGTPYVLAFGNLFSDFKKVTGGVSLNVPVNIGVVTVTPSFGWHKDMRTNAGLSVSKELW